MYSPYRESFVTINPSSGEDPPGHAGTLLELLESVASRRHLDVVVLAVLLRFYTTDIQACSVLLDC